MESLLRNKEVCFVGMSPNIEGKGLGEEIDSFEVIVRTNTFPIPKDLVVDYGEREDIMSVLKYEYINQEWDSLKGIIHYRSIEQYNTFPNVVYYRMNVERRGVIEKGIKEVTGVHPKQGSAGINIIYTCLSMGVKRLKLFGITGYQNKSGEVVDHTEYLHYVRRKKKAEDCASMRNHPAHNFKVQNDYLRILLSKGIIEMDQYSAEHFKV